MKNNSQTDTGNTPKPLDYEGLKEYGLRYIQQIGSKFWTDFNAHDPGVTILEVLTFALTDLGYRTSFEMNDLLTPKNEKHPLLDGSLFPAHEILTFNPTTLDDYRKYILENIPGIKNVWFERCEREISVSQKHNFKLNGLYDITVELEGKEFIKTEYVRRIVGRNHDGSYCKNYYEENAEDNYRKCFKHYIKNFLIKHRNLCEDFNQVTILEPVEIGICAQVEVYPNADRKKILQEIYDKLEEYVSPALPYHTLNEMLDNGKSPEEIYQGTLPRFGFIDINELKAHKKTTNLYNSDVISLLMEIEGVKSIRHFHFTTNDEQNTITTESSLLLKTEDHCLQFSRRFTNSSQTGSERPLNLVTFIVKEYPTLPSMEESGIVPRLCTRLPLDIVLGKMVDKEKQNTAENSRNLIQIKGETKFHLGDKLITTETVIDNDITPDFSVRMEPPTGSYRNLSRYHSFQNFFPKAFKMGAERIADSESNLRKAERLQLKAYLTFFDQMLSDYLEQLGSLDYYFSGFESQNTIPMPLSHRLTDAEITDVTAVQKDLNDIPLCDVLQSSGHQDKLLAHLISRFNDSFVDYCTLSYFTKGHYDSNHSLFLENYAESSSKRSQAIDYTEPLCVTGLERRILYKLGVKHPEERINIAPELISCDETYVFKDNRSEPYEDTFGMHIIEHSLLVPYDNQLDDKTFLKLKERKDSNIIENNPYSFSVTVVVPCWLNICQDRDFRKWVEATIHEEMPAHVVTKICWIDPFCMRQFEIRYKSFLTTMARQDHPNPSDAWIEEQRKKIRLIVNSFNSFENTYDPFYESNAILDSNFRLDVSPLNGNNCKWRFTDKQESNTTNDTDKSE